MSIKTRHHDNNSPLRTKIDRVENFAEIIGQSDAISSVFMRVEQVAPLNVTVLLLGETGTGKGLIARTIHRRSARKNRPMITVNCASLPSNRIEGEIFGRGRRAATASDACQIGRFELANGSTLFVEEIGVMPLELQCKLLRVLQDGEFERLGSSRLIKIDVRIIAASNRNLEDEVRAGRFREDLYDRLNIFSIAIPALRQREGDVPLLVHHFIAKFNKKFDKAIGSVSTETMHALEQYHWPGNVREMESVIERAVITSQGSELQVLDRFAPAVKPTEPFVRKIEDLAELEREHILQTLHKTGWRIEGQNGAALLLGLNPSTLRARMRKFGILRQGNESHTNTSKGIF